ncbi:acyl-CoA-binding domain-containing protein 4 isoform X2 [Polypterus senegalus]|uniref:acyl-CoA-binding domain-containing protein 4 isoform X2 n=1 Tax=Polypterus senegalus TaxID=55291 RepID=UPI0019651B79|nr:acyl-CoA-binding domain-containing protein 4 isoform X2 [Polypterus senegalus]
MNKTSPGRLCFWEQGVRPPRRSASGQRAVCQPATAMAQEEDECHRRFQTAVSVVQSLPKRGPYRPSYDAMLRFYGYYKQATCGPCTLGCPPFWDPVGRYKWDAWKRLGDMSRVVAMAAYVEEIKVVAQEVINTLPLTEGTASLFHYFEPLYHVIEDMPRPPPEFFRQPGGEHGPPHTSEEGDAEAELEEERGAEEEEESRPKGFVDTPEGGTGRDVNPPTVCFTADVIHQSRDRTASAESATSVNAATKDLKLHGQAAPALQEQRGGADTGSSQESGTKQGEPCRGPQGSVRHWSLKPAGGAHSSEVDALIARVLTRLQTEMQTTLCRLQALEKHWSTQDSAHLGPPKRVGASAGQKDQVRLARAAEVTPRNSGDDDPKDGSAPL